MWVSPFSFPDSTVLRAEDGIMVQTDMKTVPIEDMDESPRVTGTSHRG